MTLRPASLLVALLAFASPAVAQHAPPPLPAHDALRAPLRGFTPRETQLLAPLLSRGVVGLIEHDRPPGLPGIHYALTVNAPAEVVFAILSDPAGYPEFMPALSEVSVDERRGRSTAYGWRWQTAVFSLQGRAMTTAYAPPAAQRRRGYRITARRTHGDLGRGREVWRILPRGPDRCLLTLSTRMDLSNANYLTRQVSSGSRSLSRSVTMTLAMGMMLRARAEAERRSGAPPRTVVDALEDPAIDVRPLEPILLRGDMIVVDAAGDEVGQTTLITLFDRSLAQVRSVMLHPVAFAEALTHGRGGTITQEHTADGLRFDWRVDIPVLGTGGAMTLREREDETIELDAVDGALSGGRWRFSTQLLPSRNSVVTGWARFEPADAHFLLRAVVDADATFRAGMSGAAIVMLARALRNRMRLMRHEDVLPPP